jgi:cystathionine gamma-synthase
MNCLTTACDKHEAELRGCLRSLTVRVERQNASAMKIAQAMQAHLGIKRVLYPGPPNFPGDELAKQQTHGFGGMLTIEVSGGGEAATRVADALKLFALASRWVEWKA